MTRMTIVLLGLGGLALAAPVLAEQPKVSPLELVRPIADYKAYVNAEIAELVADTRAFTDAVKAGDLARAKALYAPARMHYERIEPAAELFGDLDKSIDARADDYAQNEADPAFVGFHRLEYALFAKNTTAETAAIADRLMADVLELQKRVNDLTIPPEKMVGGAAALIEEVAATKISGEEDRYSHTDLWAFQASVDGARKIVDLLAPLTKKADPALGTKVNDNLGTVSTVLGKYKTSNGGFEDYEKLSPKDRTALQGPITTLAEDLSKLRGTLGLD
jgi:iron uptake system component EfeO